MHPEPHFTRGPFTLRRSRAPDAAAVLAFNTRNRQHLAPTMPRRHPELDTEAFWAQRIALADSNFEQDRGVSMHIYDADQRAVGSVSLMNFVRGALQGCDLGYSIDVAHQGTGLMQWAVRQALDYAFTTLGLHRIQASHLPENRRSARLLARLGFRREGYLERFLLIDGSWRDHVLTALVHDGWRPRPGEEFMLTGER
jgi:ribosomal-protein-alanine N-acetyltransferase